jgi:DNA-binding transcriptional MerR regulator
MDSERRYTIAELADAGVAALDALGIAARNGQVRDRPDVRTIRYYATLGLIDPPTEMTGRTARYGDRHLLQVLAVKAVQARGDSLADAQRTLVGASDEELRSAIGPCRRTASGAGGGTGGGRCRPGGRIPVLAYVAGAPGCRRAGCRAIRRSPAVPDRRAWSQFRVQPQPRVQAQAQPSARSGGSGGGQPPSARRG